MLCFVMYTSVMDPFRLAFAVQAKGAWLLVELTASIIFVTDFGLSWNTAFLNDEGYWIVHRPSIARNYARGWMWIDLPSSIPLELIPLITGDDEPPAGLLKMLRVLRILRLARAVRLLKLDSMLNALAEQVHLNLRVVSIFRLLLLVMYMTHLLGCGWRLLAGVESNAGTDSWLADLGDRHTNAPGNHRVAIDQYLDCLLMSISMLLVVGYQDMPPVSGGERLMVILSLLLGTLVFGYMLSSVASLLQTIDLLGAWKEQRLAEVKEYLRWRRLPPFLHAVSYASRRIYHERLKRAACARA